MTLQAAGYPLHPSLEGRGRKGRVISEIHSHPALPPQRGRYNRYSCNKLQGIVNLIFRLPQDHSVVNMQINTVNISNKKIRVERWFHPDYTCNLYQPLIILGRII
jgi:hypothetical protein